MKSRIIKLVKLRLCRANYELLTQTWWFNSNPVFMIFNTPFLMLSRSTIIIRTLIALSRTNWLIIWLAIELNLIAFIPIISISTNFQETEASVKYLLIQALGSRLLILRSISIWMSHQIIYTLNIVLILSLLIKIGIAPCHIWYPSVITSIAWIPALILSSWQKLAPLSIIAFIIIKTSFLLITVLARLNALTGGLLGINQTHLRTIIAYSSITHIGWMLALIYRNIPISILIYFIMYVILIRPIFYIINKLNNKTLSQINISSHKFKHQAILLPILFLSLGGLPPLTGFFPKWFTIYLISPNSIILLFFLIAGSLINLYYYLNIRFSSILRNNSTTITWSLKNKISVTRIVYIAIICIPLVPIIIL